jgi:hypothetical protein
LGNDGLENGGRRLGDWVIGGLGDGASGKACACSIADWPAALIAKGGGDQNFGIAKWATGQQPDTAGAAKACNITIRSLAEGAVIHHETVVPENLCRCLHQLFDALEPLEIRFPDSKLHFYDQAGKP